MRLGLQIWTAAADGFAVAACLAGVLSYSAAVQHKLVCLEVAAAASAEGRSSQLGVYYDECAR